jgi:dTDP-4-dehydrorhamnose reductase
LNHSIPTEFGSRFAGAPIWVTGAGGLIGSYFARELPNVFPLSICVPLTRDRLDIADFRKVDLQFREAKPSLVIHCAAMSRSPECEANPPKAQLINVEATRHLAELAADIPLVFFSTDLVFDGKQGNYDEEAEVNPLSYYGETKAESERVVLSNPKHMVIRTSLNAGRSPSGDRGFNEQWRNAWARKQTLRLFVDEFRSPIHARVTVHACLDLVRAGQAGLFHVAGTERMSRYEMGWLLGTRCPELEPRFEPASISEYKGAPRPADTSLNCARAQNHLSFPLPRLSEFLVENPQEFY